MILKLSILSLYLVLFSFINSESEDYKKFMSHGFQRFNECDYEQAYWDFWSASLLEVSQDSVLRALYQRNIADSCRRFMELAESYYDAGNFVEARKFYQKIVFANSNDKLCIAKAKICDDKIKNQNSTNTAAMTFVSSGSFIMGNSNGGNCENVEHNVFISGLYVDIYEVTNQQYANFLNSKRISLQQAKKYINLREYNCQIFYKDGFYFCKTDKNRYPVVDVSWYGADAYAKFYKKRLPTEAEWEYFASQVNIDQNISSLPLSVVGSSKPNKLGIYDLYGNVREWCADFYWENYYQTSSSENPIPISDSDRKVVRGASFDSLKWFFTRDYELPSETSYNLGFRCVKDAE